VGHRRTDSAERRSVLVLCGVRRCLIQLQDAILPSAISIDSVRVVLLSGFAVWVCHDVCLVGYLDSGAACNQHRAPDRFRKYAEIRKSVGTRDIKQRAWKAEVNTSADPSALLDFEYRGAIAFYSGPDITPATMQAYAVVPWYCLHGEDDFWVDFATLDQ